jgi:DNA replication protein DnaC
MTEECATCSGNGAVTEERHLGTYVYFVGKRCPECWPRQLAEIRARQGARISAECGLSDLQRAMTFDGFRVFPDTRKPFEAARRYAESPLGEWLVIAGPPRNGKTHLLSAIANEAIAAKIPTLYAYLPQLLDHLREGFRAQNPTYQGPVDDTRLYEQETFKQRWERILSIDLLLLDDLGVEVDTPWVRERLDILLDVRLRDRKATAITTNLNLGGLKAISERIAGRIESYPATIVRNEAMPYHKRGTEGQKGQEGAA